MSSTINLTKDTGSGSSPASRMNLLAIILLNERSIKLLSKFLSLCPWISACLRTHQRSFFVQYSVVNIETHNWSKYIE